MKKRIMACLLAAVVVFGTAGAYLPQTMTTVQAAAVGETGTTADGFTWQIREDGTVEITKYSGEAAEIVMPDEIAGRRVTRIGSEVFHNNQKLQKLTLPQGLTDIAAHAFSNCRLKEIAIPKDVTCIESYAFSKCYYLERIEVSNENETYTSQDGVLYNKEQTELLCCPMGKEGIFVSPLSVKRIGEAAFCDCWSLTGILLPDDVTDIGDKAFYYCNDLESFIIPKSVTNVGEYAFCNCSSLKGIVVPEGLTSIGIMVFDDCSSLTEITLPKALTSIGAFPFFDCNDLVVSCYPGSVAEKYVTYNKIPYKLIGEVPAPEEVFETVQNENGVSVCAYTGNDNSVHIPGQLGAETVTELGEELFANQKVIEVILPEGVSKIGARAFADSSSLAAVTIPAGVTEIAEDAFAGSEHVVIRCFANSFTHRYAQANDIPVMLIGAVEAQYYYGDVNMDGEISAEDALNILKHVVRLAVLTDETVLELADTDHDGSVRAADALGTLKVVVRLQEKELCTGRID